MQVTQNTNGTFNLTVDDVEMSFISALAGEVVASGELNSGCNLYYDLAGRVPDDILKRLMALDWRGAKAGPISFRPRR